MAGLFGLSIARRWQPGGRVLRMGFQDTLFSGMLYLQHLGVRGGFVSFGKNGKPLKREFRGVVGPDHIGTFDNIDSQAGIAYYGDSDEPFYFNSLLGGMALCFSGRINNMPDLKREILEDGSIILRESDIEIIAELIVRLGLKKEGTKRQRILDGIYGFASRAKGSYSLLVISENRIFAVCGPDKRWPLVIGRNSDKSMVVVASETAGFSNMGIGIVRELKSGEVVSIKNGSFRREGFIPSTQKNDNQICGFLWDYTAFPTSMIGNVSAAVARKKLGSVLAEKDIKAGFFPHLVIPVPDSGRHHYLGYVHEFLRQVKLGEVPAGRLPLSDEVLSKVTAVRSFLQGRGSRDLAAFLKMVAIEDYLGYVRQWLKDSGDLGLLRKIKQGVIPFVIVVVEDSVVRGTQMESNLGPKIRSAFKPWKVEVHVRSSFPEICSHCPYGRTTERGEILALRFPGMRERISYLGVDGLKYNTPEDFLAVLGIAKDRVCMECTARP